MRKYRSLLKSVLVIAGLGLVPAFAQNAIHVTADVPFAFSVGSTKLAAGEYVISGRMGSPFLSICTTRGDRGAVLMSSQTVTDANPGEPNLTFHVIGQQRYLASVWSPSAAGGRAVKKSRAEREAEAALEPTLEPTQITLVRVPAH